MRLQQRVFGETRSGLLGFRQAQLAGGNRFDAKWRKQRPYFPNLACVMAGDDQFSGLEFAVGHMKHCLKSYCHPRFRGNDTEF